MAPFPSLVAPKFSKSMKSHKNGKPKARTLLGIGLHIIPLWQAGFEKRSSARSCCSPWRSRATTSRFFVGVQKWVQHVVVPNNKKEFPTLPNCKETQNEHLTTKLLKIVHWLNKLNTQIKIQNMILPVWNICCPTLRCPLLFPILLCPFFLSFSDNRNNFTDFCFSTTFAIENFPGDSLLVSR